MGVEPDGQRKDGVDRNAVLTATGAGLERSAGRRLGVGPLEPGPWLHATRRAGFVGVNAARWWRSPRAT